MGLSRFERLEKMTFMTRLSSAFPACRGTGVWNLFSARSLKRRGDGRVLKVLVYLRCELLILSLFFLKFCADSLYFFLFITCFIKGCIPLALNFKNPFFQPCYFSVLFIQFLFVLFFKVIKHIRPCFSR